VADSLEIIGGMSRNDVSLAREKASELAARYEEPNARLAQQLDAAGIALPGWLSPTTERSGVSEGE